MQIIAPGVAKMRVITWNLGYWQHRSRHDEAWVYLRNKIRPDLALLQEVSPPKLQEDECMLFKTVNRGWGTAIYIRNMPLKELRIERYPGRVAAAELKVSSSRRVAVVSVHAPIIKGRVFPYLAEIFDEIESVVGKRTFIVGGDLNSARLAEKVWPGYGHGPFFERLAKSVFFDCHRKFHNIEQQTFFRNGGKHPFQDDHLFVSHDLADRVRSCDVLNNEVTRSVSDHIPVVAEIAI